MGDIEQKTKIAILGCGTVGSGLLKLLERYQNIEVSKIVVRDKSKKRDFEGASAVYAQKLNEVITDDIEEVLSDDSIQIVVELMGGVERTKDVLLKALASGKNIVTANKDLLALEGKDLFESAKQHNCTIQFEAAVAGGIPVIGTLKQSLRGNKIHSVYGIINGTTNYILDAMEKESVSFEHALKCAQELGFAESDPTNDVDGHDAAYKIAIMASIISEQRVDVNKVFREGIRNISLDDIKSASKRGYRIKLLGIANNTDEGLDVRVHPVFVPRSNSLAHVAGENNAILINGDAVQNLTLIGKGAGSLPTASAVLGDVLMISSQMAVAEKPHPQHICPHSGYAKLKDIGDVCNAFYVRVSMHDKIGVLKDLGTVTANRGVNVKFIDQYDAHGGQAKGDFIVDPVSESAMQAVISDLEKLDSIKSVDSVVRVLV